jgi:hypothetical protein
LSSDDRLIAELIVANTRQAVLLAKADSVIEAGSLAMATKDSVIVAQKKQLAHLQQALETSRYAAVPMRSLTPYARYTVGVQDNQIKTKDMAIESWRIRYEALAAKNNTQQQWHTAKNVTILVETALLLLGMLSR